MDARPVAHAPRRRGPDGAGRPAIADDPAPVPAGGPAIVPVPGLTGGPAPVVPLRRSAPADDPLGGRPIGADLTAALDRRRGGGRPLPAGPARTLGAALGADVDRVRIHTGPEPSALARSVQAVAFTRGSDIYFGAGAYTPDTARGQRVLAHELAHTVQPAAGAGAVIGRAADPAEADADRRADRALDVLRRRTDASAAVEGPGGSADGPAPDTTPALRRLVGFEVEISVPTMGRAAGTALHALRGGPEPSPRVAAFFGGGLAYKRQLGSLPGPDGKDISLTPDHNQLAAKGVELFAAITEMSPAATRGAAHVELSNLEYGTPALDELAAGSDARFRAMATTIDAHVKKIMDAKPAESLSAIPDAPGFGAGVPLTEISDWLRPAAGTERFRTAQAQLLDLIKWEMYVQATVGILPTGLPALYAQQAQDMPDDDIPSTSLAAIKDAMTAVTTLSATFEHQPFVKEFADLNRGDLLSIRGVLTMAASYAVGNALGRTSLMSDTAKNSVQMLLKLDRVGLSADAMTTVAARLKGKQDSAKFREFADGVAVWIHQMPQSWLEHWTAEPYEAEVVRPPIYGRKGMDPFDATKALITDLLTGTATIPVIGPGAEGRLPRPDPVPAAIATISGGQTGIPLEFRWITEFPDGPGKLWPVFAKVLQDVRAANLHLVPEERRRAILASVAGR